VRETQRAAQRDFGVDHGQAAADVVSMDDDQVHRPLVAVPAEQDASEELLELLAWAVAEERLDAHAATILTTRYFGDPVATDRQIGALGDPAGRITLYASTREASDPGFWVTALLEGRDPLRGVGQGEVDWDAFSAPCAALSSTGWRRCACSRGRSGQSSRRSSCWSVS
jgi:hypothetical protein